MAGQRSLRLEFTSAFEMLDLVQVVSDHVGRDVGLDDDAVHWVGVAIRESVINAIKHGNQNDAGKRVFVDFETASGAGPAELNIRVRDQGAGIRPRSPRGSAGARKSPEGQRPRHLPHSQLHGRRHPPARSRGRHGDPHDQARAAGRVTPDPLYLTTAIEAVVHAGDVMMSRFGTGMRVDKKGTIDLVTEVDVAIERSFRAMIAARFPGHAVLGEEMGGSAARAARPLLGIRSDRRHHQFRPRPADLLRVPCARNRRRRPGRRRLRPHAPGALHG